MKQSSKKISKHMREFEPGQKVAVIRDPSVPSYFPRQIYGLTGTVLGKRGRSYLIMLFHGNKEKQFLVKSVHLKKIHGGIKK